MAGEAVPLEGVVNFRDLGGYETVDGRVTRTGVLYRSGALATLTPGDIAQLRRIGLKLICDLRTEDERERAPSSFPRADVQTAHLSIGGAKDGAAAKGASAYLTELEITGEFALQAILGSYGRMILEHIDQYRAMMEHLLLPGRLPALIHCTAGKDRTGLGSALVLRAVGVPHETVLQDYARTRDYLTDAWKEEILRFMVPDASPINRDVAEVMFDANPDYLNAALASLDQVYGSFDGFLRDGLHLGTADVERLQAQLLE